MRTVKVITTQIKAKEYHGLIDHEAVKQYYSRMISNKCGYDMYITGVSRIIERSPWTKLTDTKYPGAQAAIRAEIEGLTLPDGYVLSSCKITEVGQTNIVFENPYVFGLCLKSPEIGFLKKDMIVPMRVLAATYPGEKIVVTARLFRHDWTWPVISIIENSSVPDWIAGKLDELAKRMEAVPAKQKTILGLMRPADGAARQNAKRLTESPQVGINISLSEALDGTYYETTNKEYTISLPAGEAILYLAQVYVSYCECYLKMVEDYKDDSVLKAHLGLFKYIGLSQKR